jgi:cyclopropane-fatty-acyl-phospholipid synthase
MDTSTVSRPSLSRRIPAPARTVLRLLARLRHGTLTLQLPDASEHRYGSGRQPEVSVTVRDWSVFGAALKSVVMWFV